MNRRNLPNGTLWVIVIMVCLMTITTNAQSSAEPNSVTTSSHDLIAECGIPAEQADALYRLNDKVFSYEDFVLPIKQSYYELEMEHYHKQRQLIDSALWQNYLAEESKRQEKSVEDVATSLIPPYRASEAEVKAFYEGNKERIPGKFEDVKGQIEQFLAQQQALTMREDVLTKLKADKQFELLIEIPLAPVVAIDTESYPVKGNPQGEVEIVEFADYQCPHCQHAANVVKSLVEKYNNIKVVFIDFPVNRSGISRQIALGGVCAAEQKKFWEYHDLAFATQASLAKNSPEAFAKKLKLDTALFADCLQSGRPEKVVSMAKSEGQRLGVTGTPSFFVNGRKIHTHGSLEKSLSEAIEQTTDGKEG